MGQSNNHNKELVAALLDMNWIMNSSLHKHYKGNQGPVEGIEMVH